MQWAIRAGPRAKVYHDPATVTAAIVTCGGLCPGLNDVVQSIVCSLIDYGVPEEQVRPRIRSLVRCCLCLSGSDKARSQPVFCLAYFARLRHSRGFSRRARVWTCGLLSRAGGVQNACPVVVPTRRWLINNARLNELTLSCNIFHRSGCLSRRGCASCCRIGAASVAEWRERLLCTQILGIRYGLRGFYASDKKPLTLNRASVESIHLRGGTILGTSRGGADVKEIVHRIRLWGLAMVFVIGGNGARCIRSGSGVGFCPWLCEWL